MNVNVKVVMNEIRQLSFEDRTDIIGWILRSIEEECQNVSKKDILKYSGLLKSKQDGLIFEREIRNEWER
ncbi:MAG: hypothetical protein K0A90_09005 [Methanosarcinaceae archaeon]|nr:hypothetical protein [Methanosarcinaceae archaeon]MCL7410276.1 hypothetical protein [Methanosarcinaceae archaeon]HJH29464.1 hypothetical protein [Methanosarcinaceae archaeon]